MGKTVYLCSRCTGVALGIAIIFVANAFNEFSVPITIYLPLISLLPLMAVVDWFTQSAKLRESKTWIRLSSGFLLGNSEGLTLLLLIRGFYLQVIAVLGVAAIYALTIYIVAVKTKCLDKYVIEMNQSLNS